MTSVKNILRQRLAHLRASRSESEFSSLVTFYIEVLPKLMQVVATSQTGGDTATKNLSTSHHVPHLNIKLTHIRIMRLQPKPVINHHTETVNP